MTNRAVTLLTLLAANERFGQPEIHRTFLVKQVYLAETIKPLYRLWRQTFSFVRYYYGPYSEQVFQHLDTLIFNGLVEVTSERRQAGRVEARYKITPSGSEILTRVAPDEIKSLGMDLVWALQAIGVRQATAICKLVYQEAEFARLFALHSRRRIRADAKVPLPAITAANNETFATLSILRGLRLAKPRVDDFVLPSREIVRVFLETLVGELPKRRMLPEKVE
jgi:DNA-binding PadR family transcriptional regulator